MAGDVVEVTKSNQVWIARMGPWKLVIGPRRCVDDCQLFLLSHDPDERTDLGRRYRGIVDDLLLRAGALDVEDTPLRLVMLAAG